MEVIMAPKTTIGTHAKVRTNPKAIPNNFPLKQVKKKPYIPTTIEIVPAPSKMPKEMFLK